MKTADEYFDEEPVKSIYDAGYDGQPDLFFTYEEYTTLIEKVQADALAAQLDVLRDQQHALEHLLTAVRAHGEVLKVLSQCELSKEAQNTTEFGDCLDAVQDSYR